jgi:hypothetical protein
LKLFFDDLPEEAEATSTWERLKMMIQISAKDHSLHFQKHTKSDIRLLEEHRATILNNLQESANTLSSPAAALRQDLLETERQLDKCIDRSTEQLLLRSATRWKEKGERNNKYFYRVIKQRIAQQTILSLKPSRTGQRITSNNEILSEARHYYTQLIDQR